MSDQDKEVSRHMMRKRLYFRHSLISSLAATDQECAAALRTIPNIKQIEVLYRMVGPDGVWAAQELLQRV